MMRRIILVAVVGVFIAAPALADMKTIVYNNPGGANQGGPFTALVTGTEAIGENPVGSQFITFCVEETITFYPGSEYRATVDDAAITGGVGGGVTGDPVSDLTAWLYTEYLNGHIATDGDTRSAVQEAIWRIELESSRTGGPAVTWVANAQAAYDAGWRNTNIKAMNLWSGEPYSGDAQSMLVRVPVPAALLLGLLGLGAAGVKLRRFA